MAEQTVKNGTSLPGKEVRFLWHVAKAFRLAAILAAIVGLYLLWCWWTGPVHALSSFATDVQVYDGDVSPNGDFIRGIRARCSEAEFHRFARSEGLLYTGTGDLPAGCPGWGGFPVAWWTPPRSSHGVYYSYEDGGYRRLLSYQDGVLYYDIFRW